MAELKPCPCCGGKAKLFADRESWGTYYALVRCPVCGLQTREVRTGIASMLDDYIKLVTISWNRRAGEDG